MSSPVDSWFLCFTVLWLSRVVLVLTDAFRAIGRRQEAVFATPDDAAAVGAADVEDVRDVRAVDSQRVLLRHVKERIREHAPTTAFEGDIRVETLKGSRAQVHPTYPLAAGTSRQRILVGEDSVSARFIVRTTALIGITRSGRTASLAIHAAHTITERVRRRTDAFIPTFDKRRVALESARAFGGASGRRVIGIIAIFLVRSGINQFSQISLNIIFAVLLGKEQKLFVGLDSSRKCRETQADVDAALIGGAGESEADGSKRIFVDGRANVEGGPSFYVLTKGTSSTGSTGSREEEGEGRNNNE